MIKVLRIINRFNLGGPTYSVAIATKHLGTDFDIKLIGGQKDGFEESSEYILKELEVDYDILPEMKREINFKQDRIAYKKIKQIISEFKPDIVHTHAAKAGAIGRLAAHKLNVPVIIHTFHGHVFHSYFGKVKTQFYKIVERYLARRSTAIIALSDIQKHELCNIHKICAPDKTKVMSLGFDLAKFSENQPLKREQFRSEWKIENDEIAIGIVGRVVPIKNHKLFIDAFLIAKQKTSKKIKAVIIGDGDETDRLINYAKSKGLITKYKSCSDANYDIVFTSWRKDIDVVNSGLDIMCLSSLNEGTPVSLIEAQASRLPIVTTDVGGVRDITNESASISTTMLPIDFSSLMLEYVENKSLREKVGEVGFNFVNVKFHYNTFSSNLASLYRELVKNN